MPTLAVRGANSLRAVGADLRRAGSPSRGIRSKMRRNLTVAAMPVKTAVQRAARSIPVTGDRSTGLRAHLADAVAIRIVTGGRNVVVRVWVNPAKMPGDQQSLPALMEGLRRWRKPLFGNRDHWYSQPSHPYFTRSARAAGFKAAQKAAIAAVNETAVEIERGI